MKFNVAFNGHPFKLKKIRGNTVRHIFNIFLSHCKRQEKKSVIFKCYASEKIIVLNTFH